MDTKFQWTNFWLCDNIEVRKDIAGKECEPYERHECTYR